MKIAHAAIALALIGCVSAGQPAELVQLGPAPAPGPWLALRDALGGCARAEGIAGELRVHIQIDDDGGSGAVWSDDGAGFSQCVGRALARTRFPRSHRGRTIEVPYVAQP